MKRIASQVMRYNPRLPVAGKTANDTLLRAAPCVNPCFVYVRSDRSAMKEGDGRLTRDDEMSG